MALVSGNLDLREVLASKRLLLLGSSLTFNLHNHILSYASQTTPDAPPHTCLGPEFCTFHHIFLQPSNESTPKAGRKIKPPSPHDLLATHSALMHYIQSYSLASHSRPDHVVYSEPRIDSYTGVRVKETYWLGPARRADIILLNRPPIPAPAWTYDGTETGNWTFTDPFLQAEKHGKKLRTPDRYLRAVIRAALHITREKYLPEVSRTLETLRSDAGIRSKAIIWHGTLFHHNTSCQFGAYGANIFKENRLQQHVNLWAVYHDAQSEDVVQQLIPVKTYFCPEYIQEHILMSVLPQQSIVFLPLNFPTVSQDLGNFGGDSLSCVTEDADQIERKFIGNLAFVLQKMSTWGPP
ncbi:hypothetical protein FIBSPDRAFT_925677 [Athelia psychrophila]|uniref:Uncharacterized protein n=1 Tax=Athelia psychrophila TaxID=1759441 RepID=A0A166UN63_9AGAM|nr:hypothetical protein FIBSPDRAFT_925677 [Fibularhizoctonia sp. CBS 109695]